MNKYKFVGKKNPIYYYTFKKVRKKIEYDYFMYP